MTWLPPLPDLSSAKVIVPSLSLAVAAFAEERNHALAALLAVTITMAVYRLVGITHSRHEIALQYLATFALLSTEQERIASTLVFALAWSTARVIAPKAFS